ncbi:MAG: FAD-dependent oxidoreductase [Dehalococcoidales bacterium]
MTFEKIRKRAVSAWEELQSSEKPRILIGRATCGRAAGADAAVTALNEELARHNIEATITEVGCIGLCYCEPLVDIIKPGRPRICYHDVTPEIIRQLVVDYLVNDDPRPDLAMATIGEGAVEGIPRFEDLPILKPQVRISTRNCGYIDPDDIDQYIANGGYEGAERALTMTQPEVIEEVRQSGLRGRGGAGAPTAFKWERLWEAPGDEKYLICNADEGDPGAFMDRSLLESDPHSVLEGFIIGAYATGSNHGYIYCRAEYPLAIERLERAIGQMEEYGLIGDDILGSGFSFHLEIKEGAGAFVCGEETALMMSIEGKRGMPRPRPPFPAQSGLWGKPTNINNVETWANVSAIFQRNADWYAHYGTESSKGTKTLSLAGKIVRTGLIEIPMGMPLGDIIYEVGGGIVDNKAFKAVLTGGPSGGCLPAEQLDIAVDYDELTKAGTIMGSGGMVVADEDTCMVDMARFFLAFTQDESCGKCVPCRVGTKRMLEILNRITEGDGVLEDIDTLERLCGLIKSTALCGLGQTAPNPVLTTLRYFRHEYLEHIDKKLCRAGTCSALVKSPCQNACPAGIDVPRYIRLVQDDKCPEAVAVIREKVPFPAVLGYVCVHFCEAKCRRGQLEQSIAIKELKRFAADRDNGLWKARSKTLPSTGKRVAVIGSGPAGLTAGFYLAKAGHEVTVFESLPVTGGMMRVGIPRYRLPAEILDSEIQEIINAGVEIRTNSRIESVDGLFSDGYDAVFVGIGAHHGLDMGVDGEDNPGVVEGAEFLRDVSLEKQVAVGKRVVVVGGGNVAIDAARTALRLGAEDVSIVYRRSRSEMPASPEEVDAAIEEGIDIEFLTNPSLITRNGGGLEVTCLRMALGKVDRSGRPRPEPIQGSEFDIPCDTLVKAIGQESETREGFGVEVARAGRITVDADAMTTSRPGVFAGGDVVTGPASVIEAIADGRRAAIAIDRYLGGEGDIDEVLAPVEESPDYAPPESDEAEYRPPLKAMPVGERITCFRMAELGFADSDGKVETARCLRCDLEDR